MNMHMTFDRNIFIIYMYLEIVDTNFEVLCLSTYSVLVILTVDQNFVFI